MKKKLNVRRIIGTIFDAPALAALIMLFLVVIPMCIFSDSKRENAQLVNDAVRVDVYENYVTDTLTYIKDSLESSYIYPSTYCKDSVDEWELRNLFKGYTSLVSQPRYSNCHKYYTRSFKSRKKHYESIPWGHYRYTGRLECDTDSWRSGKTYCEKETEFVTEYYTSEWDGTYDTLYNYNFIDSVSSHQLDTQFKQEYIHNNMKNVHIATFNTCYVPLDTFTFDFNKLDSVSTENLMTMIKTNHCTYEIQSAHVNVDTVVTTYIIITILVAIFLIYLSIKRIR